MRYQRQSFFTAVVSCLLLVAWNQQQALQGPLGHKRPILKIAVMSDGRITVDGSPATIESVRAALKQLASEKGMVWYYREAAQRKAPPQAVEVIRAVIENRLPVRISSRPDYSDSIDMDGKPIPERRE